MSVRKTASALLVCVLFIISACSALPFGGPTATPAPTLTPTPISISDPTFLAGLWKGEYGGAEVAMTFDLQGNVSVAVYGNLQAGTYTLNITTTPYQLDMDMGDVGVITTIVEFVDSNTIKIENVYPTIERPSIFNDFFLLTRSSN